MTMIMYITFFCTITLLAMLFFSLFDARKKRVTRRLKTFLEINKEETKEAEVEEGKKTFRIRLLVPFIEKFKSIFKLRLTKEKESKLEIRLVQAGSPFGMTPIDFWLLQTLLLFILPTTFGLLARLGGADVPSIILIVSMSTIVAMIMPNYYLNQNAKLRCITALKELPDVVDLLTVSLEAGLGFDSALSKVISKKNGVLSSEFHRCLEEIRLGKTRRDALKGIQDRLLLDELYSLINSILQAEKLGISMVHILRIQSHEIRQHRKQRAEEAAMKAPIKMLFPLVLFIFPSLFIVLLGPALIQFITTFQ